MMHFCWCWCLGRTQCTQDWRASSQVWSLTEGEGRKENWAWEAASSCRGSGVWHYITLAFKSPQIALALKFSDLIILVLPPWFWASNKQAAYEKAQKKEQSSSSRPGGMPGGFPGGGMPGGCPGGGMPGGFPGAMPGGVPGNIDMSKILNVRRPNSPCFSYHVLFRPFYMLQTYSNSRMCY